MSAEGGTQATTTWVSTDELVTGEAVTLDLPPASIGPRILSGLIDLVTAGLALIALFYVGTAATRFIERYLDEALVRALVLVMVMLVLLGIPVATETLTRGKTLGKLVMGLRTVRDDAGPITFRHAMARGLVGVVEIYLFQGVPALITAVVSQKGKRLGDLAAGTYVIRERIKLKIPQPVEMPVRLEAWARTADLGALPDGLAATVRTFLGRASNLTPQARATLGQSLLAEVLPYVAPMPPQGTPVEVILAAVIAERRQRDLDRLERDDRLRRSVLRVDRQI